jgi:FAD-linked sulfhydryl oxidase
MDSDVLHDFQIDNCRVCFDIKDWRKRAQKAAFENKGESQKASPSDASTPASVGFAGSVIFTAAETEVSKEEEPVEYKACPPDAMELGRSTWTFLHTMSVYYPDNPTTQQQSEMSSFLSLFSKYYPCSYCARHLRDEMKNSPPVVDTRSGLTRWLCRMHNEVNERLGKPIFDCDRVDERWKDGPSDGSCS